MGTAGVIVDRVYREYLQRPNDQPIKTVLTGPVVAGAGSLPLNRVALEEEDNALLGAPGILIEVKQELMRVTGDPGGDSIDVARHQEGTIAAAHDTGDTVTVSPVWSRLSVFDAVADAIVNLYPEIWHTKHENVVTGVVNELPADVTQLLGFRYLQDGTWVRGAADLLVDFPNVSTSVAVQFPAMAKGLSGYVTCKTRFTRPVDEAATVTDIEPDWVQLVVIGAVVNLAAQTDLDDVQSEILTRALEQQNFPVGTGERVSRAAIRQYQYHLQAAKQELKLKYGIPTSIGGSTYGGA